MPDFIPVNEPCLNGRERDYLIDCIDSGWISSEGPFVERLEREFAGGCGRRHGIAVCNGSAALDLAIAALRIGPGDEVILPSFTIISCAAAVVRAGATPVLVDSDPIHWNMDVAAIESRISTRTRAIMVVHTYGLPTPMEPVLDLARRHGLRVIEDAAEAHGLKYRDQACGGFGDISTFSFYPNKHVTTGEGGMVLCDDEELAARCRSLRNLAFEPERRFVHKELGWNFRMSNLQAAVGVAQLERLDEFVERKRQMGQTYSNALSDLPLLQLPLQATADADNIYWVYGLVLDDRFPLDAAGAMAALRDRGIGTRPFFWPMHEQPVFLQRGLFAGERYPVAEKLARRGLYLPSGLGLTATQQSTVISAVRELCA